MILLSIINSVSTIIATFGATGSNPNEFYGDGRFNANLTITGVE